MFKKKLLLLVLTISMVFTCSACSNKKEKFAVTAYPIEYLTQRIGGPEVEVNCISENTFIQGASLKSNAKDILNDSSTLFYIRELEPYFDVYSELLRESEATLINLSNKTVYYDFQRYTTTTINGKTTVVEGDYYDGDIFENIDIYESDPFLWMDPISLISVAEIIRDVLIEYFPENRNFYNANFESLEMDLTRLDMEYQNLKTFNNDIAFVSMTPSFGIWQKTYGISVYPISLSKYGAKPSDEQLAVIKQKIIDDEIKYIVYEPNLNKELEDIYESLKEELGLIELNISNLSSLSIEQRNENKDYFTIMYENLSELEKVGNKEI